MTPSEVTLPLAICVCRDLLCKIPYGECHCSCGGKPKISPCTDRTRGYLKGFPRKYCQGHNPYWKPKCEGRAQDRYYQRLKEAGKCRQCRERTENGKILCAACNVLAVQKTRKWREKNGRIKRLICVDCDTPVFNHEVLCPKHRFKICLYCGNRFDASRNRGRLANTAKYCSRSCTGKANNPYGALNRNWKGGPKTEAMRVRKSPEMQEWRRKVLQRDDWICQDCGDTYGNGHAVYLHAHHIKPFAKHPELRIELSNGVTLCDLCHAKRHGKKEWAWKRKKHKIQIIS